MAGHLQTHSVWLQGRLPCHLALQAGGAESVSETPPWSACSTGAADPAAACVFDCAVPAGCWGLVLMACSGTNSLCRLAGTAAVYSGPTHLLSCFLLSECCRLCWTLVSEGMFWASVQLITLKGQQIVVRSTGVNA